MGNCFVYVLADTTGIRYIGVSIEPEQRLKNHVHEATNKKNKSYNIRKSRWLRKIDFDFRHRIIFQGTETECYEKEVKLISLALSKGKKLVNTSKGGEKPPKITDLPNYAEIVEKIRAKSTGRIPSDETRRRMSEAHKINPTTWFGDVSGYNNPRSRAVVQMDMDGNVIFIWATAKEAADAIGISKSTVTTVLKGNQSSTKGFKFDYF